MGLFNVSRAPTASRAAHHGHMGHLALLSPFGQPKPLPAPGIPMGYYDSLVPYRQDIHLWKRLGLIEAPIVFTDADIGAGKTSLAIVSALNAANLAVEEGRSFKIMYEITRRNLGVAELSSLTRELNATVVDMATYGLNIFDQQFGLTPGELLDVVLECFNYIERRDATTLEVTIFMAALRVFMDKCQDTGYAAQARNGHFEKCLAALSVEQAQQAVADVSHWDIDSVDRGESWYSQPEVPSGTNPDFVRDAVLAAADVRFDSQEFERVRNACLLSFARLRRGEFGMVFDGSHSLTELFENRALGIDLTGLNDTTIGLVQTLLWKFKRSAANSGDEERRRRFTFDWEIHDENRESWLHAPYRREVPRYLKRIRAVNCVMWFNVHRIPGDYQSLPAPANQDALNAVREGNIYYHGLHDGPAARQTCEFFEYSSRVETEMQRLRKGEFIVRVGSQPPQKVRIVLSKSQKASTFSEEASRSKTRLSPELAALADNY